MRLLIADDDDYTRLGLIETIDWPKFGVSEIKQARDGAEALEIAISFQPDIVLTDIRMPKLNGIEFAEKLTTMCKESKLLFMSGYMDIDYLRSAIKLAAVDYIEKPIKLNELEAAIIKTVTSIHEKQNQNRMMEQNQEMQKQKLAGLLNSRSMNTNDIHMLCKATSFPMDTAYICLIVWDPSGEIAPEKLVANLYAFWQANRIPSLCRNMDHHKYLVILAMKRQDIRRINYYTERFLRQYEILIIGIGAEAVRIEHIPTSFHTAVQALERFFYHPNLRSFTFEDKNNHTTQVIDLYPEFLELLKSSPQKLGDWINAVCERLSYLEYPHKERVCELFNSFAQAMIREKSTFISKLHDISHIHDLENHFGNCGSIFEAQQYMSKLLSVYMEEMEESSQFSRVVRDVMDYIASNCSNVNLDIREIADHVHLSMAHLGMLFKNDTGITIKQYIGDYRLELAKKLIANEHYKINVIAELCGYASASYFTKVFRAATELTPLDYRKLIMK